MKTFYKQTFQHWLLETKSVPDDTFQQLDHSLHFNRSLNSWNSNQVISIQTTIMNAKMELNHKDRLPVSLLPCKCDCFHIHGALLAKMYMLNGVKRALNQKHLVFGQQMTTFLAWQLEVPSYVLIAIKFRNKTIFWCKREMFIIHCIVHNLPFAETTNCSN